MCCSCAGEGGDAGDGAHSLMGGMASSGVSSFTSVSRGVADGEGLSGGGASICGEGLLSGQGSISSSSVVSPASCHLALAVSRLWRSASVARGRWAVVGLESAFGGFVGLCRGSGVAEACLASQAALARARASARSGWLRARVSARFLPRPEALLEGTMSALPLPLFLAVASRCCCWWR